MKKYFFFDGSNRIGPLTKEELVDQIPSRNTKVWFYGLVGWVEFYKCEEFKEQLNLIPPSIPAKETSDNVLKEEINKKHKANYKKWWIIIGVILLGLIIVFSVMILRSPSYEEIIYEKVKASTVKSDENFQFYLEKYYRDLEYYGIFPTKPKSTIITLANLDQFHLTSHIHGICYGSDDDNKIEIYINKSSWEKFNRAKRYLLIYHELSHDLLNLDDLEDKSIYYQRLMYPGIGTYENYKMDDFIEAYHNEFKIYRKKN